MNEDLQPLLVVQRLSKAFGATQALSNVDLDVSAGEIHALVGENGAGKSTLIKILAGVYPPSAGAVVFDGVPVDPTTERLPISFIHQDLGLVDSMSVAENVALVAGYQRGRRGLISWRACTRSARAALAEVGSQIDPQEQVGDLQATDKALVAIARALAVRHRLFVLDEPTSMLPHHDVERLFSALRRLRAGGIGVIYVTHRLDEVLRLADRLTVLRDGRRVATRSVRSTDHNQIVADITGRDLTSEVVNRSPQHAAPVLTARAVRTHAFGPIDFDIAKGEIVAFAGIRGAGHFELARTLIGDLPLTGGSLVVHPSNGEITDTHAAIAAGFGFVPSKRIEEGLASPLTVRENLHLNPRILGYRHRDLLTPWSERRACGRMIDRYGVRPTDPELPVMSLSGGNQQKVVLGRAIEMATSVLVLEEPTAGVDVGAKADIYALMSKTAAEGLAIVLVSSDFEEVARISDRVMVLDRGRIVRQLVGDDAGIDEITRSATGGDFAMFTA